MSNLRFRLQLIAFALMLGFVSASAQEIRYVSKSGDNSNDGTSWATAKKDVQDAINDLVNNNLTGEVWVAAGTYYPTETTESSSSPYHKSFKIPAGITVRGGFRGKVEADDYAGETTLEDRHMDDDDLFGKATDDGKSEETGNLDGEKAGSGVYSNKTILCGDLNEDKVADVTWNEQKQQFDVTFYGNSYHVVWFAMNGFDPDGRALPLTSPAKLEGCVVKGGHAYTNDASDDHPHVGYGGGIYMVANSFVYNSEVKECDASRNGGGIYMDGGGIVRRTFVHDCQALGIGTEYGLGGGICEEASSRNSKTNPIVVAQSAVVNCAARMGGGMALIADKAEGNNKYAIVANSTLVNNNTAQVEAGGVYTYKGGGLASMTIVRNKCNGSGIMQNGVITGRSGGVYCRDAAYIGNTVIWGNECAANKDIQYADSRSSLASSEKTKFYYSALSNAEVTDWSKTEKMGVLSLDEANTTDVANKGNKGYPLFEKPTIKAGYITNYSAENYDWKVFSESALHHAGINTADLDYEGLTPAPQGVSYDMQFGIFNSRCTMGAIVSEEPLIDSNNDLVSGEAHFFVDPSYNFATHHDGVTKGKSWDLPTRFLGNVLEYINADRKKTTQEFKDKKIFIHVKEGVVDNTDSYKSGRVRTTSLDIPSNVTLLGSYDAKLTGTDLSKRNPVLTPTVISGKLLDDYKYNIAHLINLENDENVTIDGFKITLANANSTELGNTNQNGAAITIKGSTTGIKFKNIIVSNCYGDKGTVIYADASTADFENCIFHNNTTATLANSGLIYGTNGSNLSFDHCNVLRSVGHASYLGTNTKNEWNNSMFYGNLDRQQDNTNNAATYALVAFTGPNANNTNLTGGHNMFDTKTKDKFTIAGNIDGASAYNANGLNYTYQSGTANGYPRMVNPTKNAGYSEEGDVTYYGRATSFEPHNDNPVVNAASYAGDHSTWGKDIVGITRDFGGLPDIGAVESHKVTDNEILSENGNPDGQMPYGAVMYVRDYTSTGTPMETYNQDGTKNTGGLGIYNAKHELLDGSSWARAINGNATYTLSGTRTYKDVTDKDVMGFRLHVGDMYLDVNDETLNRVNCAAGSGNTGSIDNPDNPEVHEQKPEDCDVFVLCGTDGKELALGSTINGTRRLKIASTGEYLYLDYTNNQYSFRTSLTPPSNQANATITKVGDNYTIRYTANRQNRYIYNDATIPSATQTAWTFGQISGFKVQEGSGDIKENQPYDLGDFNGLQYAVNKANLNFSDEYSLTGDLQNSRKQVWVGAGVYASNPKVTGTADNSSDTDPEAENCFVIKDGVDVYGAFPKTGTPGMNEREALVSQYVHVLTERGKAAADYETILQPKTEGVAVDVTRRVLGQTWDYNPKKSGYKIFYGAKWDGFTLRNGVLDAARISMPNRHGGAGAAIYNNVTLKNVVVTNNTTIYKNAGTQQDFRAGGIYMDGGTLDAGYVINNKLESYTESAKTLSSGAAYGGGMYIYRGTVFNSVIARNSIYANYADGAGTFIEDANFFNNTIVYNKAEGTSRKCGGVAIWNDAASRGTDSELNVYNCIIAKNEGTKLGKVGNANMSVQNGGVMNINYCITEDIKDLTTSDEKSKIVFKNSKAVTGNYSNIFVTPSTTGDESFDSLNLRLVSTSSDAINTGNDAPVIHGAVYNLTAYNDMDFDDRIQNCRIDIGAYEFNGSTSISPDVTSVSGQAIYYVTPNGYGTTNANDPENAACASKLQKVIDAAGRYKLQNPTTQVIVKVANGYDLLHPNNGTKKSGDDGYIEPTNFTYYATRTTNLNSTDTRMWSIEIPRGVEVWGGYSDVPTMEDANGNVVKNTTNTAWSNSNNGFMLRSITANPTYFDSYFYNKDMKINANSYHVLTFTDRVYDIDGVPFLKSDIFNEEALKEGIDLATAKSTAIGNDETDETRFAHMSDIIGKANVMATKVSDKTVSNRAVVDGIFVTGGKADGKSISGSSNLNANGYGGAAIVTDYAYVRNCILTGNSATNGGALALTDRAFVSGCLIVENNADNMGGGLYVFENGSALSNGITVKTDAPVGEQMDVNMAHVFTSTIVNNKAQQGGGIWFTSDVNSNARFNSVAVWQNEAADQDNVYGMVNPEQPTEDETISEVFYPFSFSLIENVRASGSNNLEAMGLNREGVRFVNKDHDLGQAIVDQYDLAVENETAGENEYADFGYYGLTKYSTLCSNGMPKSMYDKLIERIAISEVDILNQPRKNEINNFVEIGARALPKLMPNKVLMLRLFVAHPDVVDTKTATQFMRLNEKPDADLSASQKYYSQMGSSFAYPFNFLQDAIDYITRARNGHIDGLKLMDGTTDATSDIVRNLPFEIVLGKGTYYPKQGLNGQTESVWAQTFAIPEGVTIIGGFNPEGGVSVSDPTYYGRYYKADKTKAASTTAGDIYTNVNPIPTDDAEHRKTPGGTEVGRGNLFGDETVSLPKVGTAATAATGTEGQPDYVPAKPASSDYMAARTVKFQQWHIQDIADRRAMNDNNKNGIIEPWEFANQTIISGNAVNGETDGVYHIMTAVADEDAVGRMPKVQQYNKDKENNWLFTGINNTTQEGNPSDETGYQWKEMGQQIRLNGLIITGGNALTYLSTALDDYGSYIFYQGAGLQVDGNRYKNNQNNGLNGAAVFHNSAAYGVGYRDIPVSVTNCQFRNNVAGYGGAISTNGSLSLFGSSFEQNLAIAATEKPEDGEKWYSWVNDQEHAGSGTEVKKVMYPGQGGAILATGQLSAFNTLFANNEARYEDEYEEATITPVVHPTFRVPGGGTNSIRAAGGAIMMGSAAQHHIVNCDFVRNKANAYPAVFTMNPTTHQDDVVDTHSYSQIINTVAWGNEVNPEMLAKYSGNAAYKTASKLMVNIGRKDRDQGYVTDKSNRNFYNPSFTDGNVPSNTDLSVDNAEATATNSWQESVWFCAYEDGVGFKPNNTNDLREAIVYSAGRFAPTMIKEANNSTYQNCNMLIVSDNDDVAGPNFGNPSVKAGFDGFMEGADWSPSRFNRLTDNGNGWITQNVETTATDINVTFPAATYSEGKPSNFQGAYPYTHYISDIVTGKFPEYKLWLALGNEKYMEATNDPETRDLTINGTPIHRAQKNYPRISPDPTIGVTKAYIDIGVYEYQKQPLLKPGSEVDILWVSTKEKPENGPATGATWKTPTSDLQRAIETLLQSRNGHKKEIRIMEGEYAPVTPQTITVANPDYNSEIPGSKPTIDVKFNAFVIDTKSLNEKIIAPSTFTGSNNEKFYAQSLTIKGGYSSDIMYEYDPVKYKTVIRQNESAEGNNTNYLFYVADPTVRYAFTSNTYPTNSSDGAVVVGTTGEAATAKTMPIQIDGITLINNKAAAEVSGSAIYYPDVTPTSSHSVNVGADVVYYTDGKHTEKSGAGKDGSVETDYPSIEGGETMNNPAKIVITKAHIIGSGNPTSNEDATKASAVYIGQNGGHALIYNTVFHSNYGMPLNAYNTVNVNNTFGLNAGKVQLTGTESEMHNSALWKNNGGAAQVYFGDAAATGSDKFTYNSYTGATTDETNHLTSLADVNSNIGEGPNFIDPENADIEARSFDIKPSMRLLNQGNLTDDSGLYYDKIQHYYLGKVAEVDKYAAYDYALSATTGVDAANRTRIKNNIDRGAYEFQGSLYGILYVDPNKSHDDAATGENWDNAFGYGDLQNAMDLAAIYHASTPAEEAYVFVKGASSTNKTLNTNETLVIRDGVTTYGSIISSYTDWHNVKKEDGTTPKYETLDDYIKDLTSIREGVASNAASKTIVTGIQTDGDANYDAKSGQFPALVDGFVVTNPTETTTPVVDITNPSENAVIVVRNVVVADNNVTGGANVAQISNGLIYEALFRDNKTTGAALKVSNYTENNGEVDVVKTRGYAVNVTVEGKTIDADGNSLVDTDGGQIFKSITNSINSGTGANKAGANAPYGQITNKGISGYFYNIADPNLNYQLTETSKYIDMCDATNPLTSIAPNLAQYINYDTDRDILGNPRWLKNVSNETSGTIDRGAFETWRVDKNFKCGDDGTIASVNTDDTYALINKHFYPHDGSVVYVMENKNLIIDPVNSAHEVKPTPENPGYLLIKEGASFYGNGRPVTAAYVAVERKVRKGGSIVAVPYAMQYNENVSKPKYATGVLTELDDKVVSGAYEYNGLKRSDWKYIFETETSKCWNSIDNNVVTTANRGVLFTAKDNAFGTDETEVTLRFTGKGNGLTDYIYTETSDSYKNVTLTKYDDAQSTNNGADFTDELDMGWNCFGIPYLVSEYKPYEKASTAVHGADNNGKYMMNIPHTLWLYYDGVHTPDFDPEEDAANSKLVDGDGGYYSVKAWKSEDTDWHVASGEKKALWVGEGFFTQTATLDDTEALTFYRPVAPALSAKSSAPRMNARYFYDANGIEVVDDELNGGQDNGSRVVKYVKNGKVYIVKDGKTYNAAGQIIEK